VGDQAQGPPPGWTTSEFWSTVLVDVIAVAAMVLTFAGGSDPDLEGVEAVVPAAAVIMSGLAHIAYSHGRVRLKLGHLQHIAGETAAEARRLEPIAKDLAPIAEAADPALARRAEAAIEAEQAAREKH
jgi:hypothetical protein